MIQIVRFYSSFVFKNFFLNKETFNQEILFLFGKVYLFTITYIIIYIYIISISYEFTKIVK